jgi:histidinol-phosphatase
MPSYAHDLDLALDLANLADGLTLDRFRARDLVVETKPDLTPVTDADRAAEVALRERLQAGRPADAVQGEEYGNTGSAARRWILDPIDGTKNFVRGVPVWATLIALVADGDPVVGVVSAPALGRRWWAARGEGAWVGGLVVGPPRQLRVSQVAELSSASFSCSDHVGWTERGLDNGFRVLTKSAWRYRAYGDFWSHMLVAEGAVDVAAEPDLAAWDMAALVPIVEEAGGRITAVDGRPALEGGSAVTTNGLLHATVLATLNGS